MGRIEPLYDPSISAKKTTILPPVLGDIDINKFVDSVEVGSAGGMIGQLPRQSREFKKS
jgi:hypothetical protein